MSDFTPGFIDPHEALTLAGIAPGFQVVDLGCGALGHFTFPASELIGPHGRVYAVDVHRRSVEAIERAAKERQVWNIRPVWSDAETSQAAHLPAEQAHLTILSNILHLVSDRESVWREAYRLTRPGGRVLVIEWTKDPVVFGPPFETRLDAERLHAEALQIGWVPLNTFQAGRYHAAFVFRRPDGIE